MKLGKSLNKVKTLKDEGLLNDIAFLHFNVNKVINEIELAKKLGNNPTKGLYMQTTLLVFHDEYDLEHSNIQPPNTKAPEMFHLEPKDASQKELRLLFKGVDFKNNKDEQAPTMKMTQFKFWIHEDLAGMRLKYKVDGLQKWDTIFCEADIPDF